MECIDSVLLDAKMKMIKRKKRKQTKKRKKIEILHVFADIPDCFDGEDANSGGDKDCKSL